jgi:GDPmannose 4,6-dehydratase
VLVPLLEGLTVANRALITGITGQDGSYLAELLLNEGYEVIGMMRRSSTVNIERISHIRDDLTLVSGDLMDEVSLINVLRDYHPSEVYNLAAQTFVQASWTQPVLTGETTALGVTRHRRLRHPLLPGQLLGDVRAREHRAAG